MKSVLISIQPKWCKLIASGKKTIEVRKTRPKIDCPFKVYIYETKTVYVSKSKENDILIPIQQNMGKIIGEFVCDEIGDYYPCFPEENEDGRYSNLLKFFGCLSKEEVNNYGNGKTLYGWHISDLVIYDKPKELSCFGLKRPPQSWCYVEELEQK